MVDEKADYREIAELYDQARTGDAHHLDWRFQRIADEGHLGPGRRLLDLGCGAGRWTIPLVQRSGREEVGLDRSAAMPKKVRAKDVTGRVTCRLGDAEHLDLEPESLDCVHMCLLLHHLTDSLLRMIDEQAYEAGMRRFDDHLARRPEDPWLREDIFTRCSARKPV